MNLGVVSFPIFLLHFSLSKKRIYYESFYYPNLKNSSSFLFLTFPVSVFMDGVGDLGGDRTLFLYPPLFFCFLLCLSNVFFLYLAPFFSTTPLFFFPTYIQYSGPFDCWRRFLAIMLSSPIILSISL